MSFRNSFLVTTGRMDFFPITEERWLCSVDIACGVALGYWSASPLIGGASGAAFWLVNRLLIAGYLLRTLPVRVRS